MRRLSALVGNPVVKALTGFPPGYRYGCIQCKHTLCGFSIWEEKPCEPRC
jgi:hypothetical protein